jgi:hypothetical protein
MGLNDKEKQEFKKTVYDPYSEAWTIMKFLRDADITSQATWDEYMNKCNEFNSKFVSEIGESIYRVLLDCGSEVSRIVKS